MNHKISTYSLITLILLGSILMALGFTSEELDDICNTNNALIKRISGTWACSTTHYAQGWFHNATNPITISINTTGQYYNITGYTIDNAQGFTTGSNYVIVNKTANYRLIGTASFYGGNAGDYEWELFINGIQTPACAWHRTTSTNAVGDATMSCILSLTAGQQLQIRVEDQGAPAQDVNIEAFNFNIMEIQ